MSNKVLIKEIFKSIQGEGLYVGVSQVFVRFSRCNLHCEYCDTDFKSNLKEYDKFELADILNGYKNIHSVSLTGGEPLMEFDFLSECLPLIQQKIYLETNGILFQNLRKIIDYLDIVSMDIKLPSCTNGKDLFNEHEEFIKAAKGKEIFAKIVFDEKIVENEIIKCCKLGEKYGIPLILQPKTKNDKHVINKEFTTEIFEKFVSLYPQIRLIPQVHKFLNLR